MNALLIGLTVVFALVLAGLTFYAVREVNNKIREYETVGDSLQDEINRSHNYESESLKVNLKSLTWIWGIICLVILIICIIFVFFF